MLAQHRFLMVCPYIINRTTVLWGFSPTRVANYDKDLWLSDSNSLPATKVTRTNLHNLQQEISNQDSSTKLQPHRSTVNQVVSLAVSSLWMLCNKATETSLGQTIKVCSRQQDAPIVVIGLTKLTIVFKRRKAKTTSSVRSTAVCTNVMISLKSQLILIKTPNWSNGRSKTKSMITM